jgi:hypothetical protein
VDDDGGDDDVAKDEDEPHGDERRCGDVATRGAPVVAAPPAPRHAADAHSGRGEKGVQVKGQTIHNAIRFSHCKKKLN